MATLARFYRKTATHITKMSRSGALLRWSDSAEREKGAFCPSCSKKTAGRGRFQMMKRAIACKKLKPAKITGQIGLLQVIVK
ncbi:hypothetical protein CL635_01165 [bacterium]|nr:hypothetical protein [bacterium]